MSLAKITCIGFEEYLNGKGKSLFDEAVFPPGVNRDDLIKRILFRAGEFECVYSNPEFMIGAIGIWAKSYYHTFERWIKALSTDYNPLENYNRTEIWDDKADNTNTAENHSGTSGTDTGKVSGYDSNEFVNKDQMMSSSSTNSNGKTVLDGKTHHEGHLYGNIGVTTSQQMLEAEFDVARFNLMDQIADLFVQEYCICVY